MNDLPGRLEVGGGGEERRRAPRVRKSLDLHFRIHSLPGEKELVETLDKLLAAQSHDLSETGICLWTTRVLMPATVIELDFPGSPRELAIRARVVWCQPVTEGGYLKARAGLEFMDLDAGAKKFLAEVIGQP